MPVLRALRGLFVTVVVGGVVLGACLAALIPGAEILAQSHAFTQDLVTNLRDLDQRSVIYDSAGNEIGTLGKLNRENVTLSQVPKVIIDAVVATEDQTFWTNDGIDLGAVARAALKNLTSGEIEQGGSTISQQLIKNRVLSPKRDLNRKIREILLAIQLNKDYTKEEILEQYLNTVYFGQGSYGIKAAVERFFIFPDPTSPFGFRGATLETVTLGQAALLAGLIRNPEGDNPFLYPDRARQRRATVLKTMVKQGYITQAQADAANQEPLVGILPPAELKPSDAWVAEVQRRLVNDPRYSVLGATPEAREQALLTGGLRIYTTKDPVAQANAESAVYNNLPNPETFTAALVAMDPNTGAVRAMVSGPGFENSQYNIVTTPIGRQVGSTWKVITLGAAMQSHYSANDLVDGSSPCDFGKLGKTQNAEGGSGGVATLRSQTAGSVNCAFVRLQLSLGFPKVIDMAKKMGITQNTLQPYLTLTLGSIEATPLEMATVASTIAAGGIHHSPYFVDRIVGPDGVTIYEEQHPGDRALDADAAACEISLLRGVVTGGTGTAAAVPGHEVAGKTGTTDSRADAWFLGMTPQLTAVVWHGNANERVPGAGFGGQVPARIFQRFMAAELEDQPALPWPNVPGWCNAPGQYITTTGRQATPEEVSGPVLIDQTPPTVIINRPAPTTPPTKPPVTAPPTVPPTTPTTKPPTTTPTTPGGQGAPKLP